MRRGWEEESESEWRKLSGEVVLEAERGYKGASWRAIK